MVPQSSNFSKTPRGSPIPGNRANRVTVPAPKKAQQPPTLNSRHNRLDVDALAVSFLPRYAKSSSRSPRGRFAPSQSHYQSSISHWCVLLSSFCWVAEPWLRRLAPPTPTLSGSLRASVFGQTWPEKTNDAHKNTNKKPRLSLLRVWLPLHCGIKQKKRATLGAPAFHSVERLSNAQVTS